MCFLCLRRDLVHSISFKCRYWQYLWWTVVTHLYALKTINCFHAMSARFNDTFTTYWEINLLSREEKNTSATRLKIALLVFQFVFWKWKKTDSFQSYLTNCLISKSVQIIPYNIIFTYQNFNFRLFDNSNTDL